MKLIYVAGPFRGNSHWDIHQNIRRAEELALQVWRLGAAAICPHLNTIHFQDELPDHVWMDGDLEIVKRCDGVLMTSDWERSKGATKEREVALSLNIPVFYGPDDLQEWLESHLATATI